MKNHILIVEDDKEISKLLTSYLMKEQYAMTYTALLFLI